MDIRDSKQEFKLVDIISYDKEKHRVHIEEWLSHREMNPALGEDLPSHSYVAVLDDFPVAAAGLLKSDSEDAFLMGLITNPSAGNYLRSEAIDELTEYIIQKSKRLGFKRLFAWSSHESVIERSKLHGFEVMNQVMIGLDLRGD